MIAKLLRTQALVLIIILLLLRPGQASAQDSLLQLYTGGNESDGLPANQPTNTVFYDQTFSFAYTGGSICLSSQDGVCSPAAVDDAVSIYVDGTQVFYQESYTQDFGPVDFSGKLHAGATNQVRVQLIDLMGPSRGGSALWLVPTSAGNASGPILPVEPQSSSSSSSYVSAPCPTYAAPPPDSPFTTVGMYGGSVLRDAPSLSAKIIGALPEPTDQFVQADYVAGPICMIPSNRRGCSDITHTYDVWYEVSIDGLTGWNSDCDHAENGTQPPSQPAQPTQILAQPTQTALAQPLQPASTPLFIPTDVPIPACFWSFIPGGCVYAAETIPTCHPQCVEEANILRPDLPNWGLKWTPAEIFTTASSQPIFQYQGQAMQVRVRDNAKENPKAGDLVIWPAGCGEVPSAGGGHIGFVNNSQPFKISDSNWDNKCDLRTNVETKKLDCMSFITPPYPPQVPDYNYKLQPDFSNGNSGPGSGKPKTGILDWFINLFGGGK